MLRMEVRVHWAISPSSIPFCWIGLLKKCDLCFISIGSNCSRTLQCGRMKWISGIKSHFHSQISPLSFPGPSISGKGDLVLLPSTWAWAARMDVIHLLLLMKNVMLPNGALRRWRRKNLFSSSSDAQINLAPPHCYKNITIIKHLCQPKSIPTSFAPVGRPAANKALNLRETFLQLLIKYNTAKFHLQHIILIMGMEIIHSIAIQK